MQLQVLVRRPQLLHVVRHRLMPEVQHMSRFHEERVAQGIEHAHGGIGRSLETVRETRVRSILDARRTLQDEVAGGRDLSSYGRGTDTPLF